MVLKHKFRHSFQKTLNAYRDCDCEVETTARFLLHHPQFSIEQKTLLNKIKSIDTSVLSQSDSNFNNALLFGDSCNNTIIEALIINTTADFVLDAKGFDVSFV